MSPQDLYNYKAKINRVIDGDTYTATIDVGFNLTYQAKIRLLHCDTPEMTGPDAARGRQARDEVHQLLAACDWEVLIHVEKYDNFGRCLGSVWFDKAGHWTSLSEHLITNGFAKPYMATFGDLP